MEAFFNHLGYVLQHAVCCRFSVPKDHGQSIAEAMKRSSSVTRYGRRAFDIKKALLSDPFSSTIRGFTFGQLLISEDDDDEVYAAFPNRDEA